MGRLIRQGNTGADVRAIQDVLNFHVRRIAPLTVDGNFGPLTHAKLLAFQKSNALQADGIVGPATLAKLFEEEMLPISIALTPRQGPTSRLGIQPPRLIPPLTLPPLIPPLVTPIFLPPDSSTRIPALTPAGQTMAFNFTVPARNDPQDPAMASFVVITRLLDNLPATFPFRGAIIGAVPKPVKKVGPLQLDPVAPMSFGFRWGVKPLFDFKSVGPPLQFAVGASANASYVFRLIDKPGSTVPQLGLIIRGDFGGTIDWTSESAQSRPQVELKGSFFTGLGGVF